MKTYFAETHEKLTVEGNIATLTLSDHAIDELGDIVFLEFPEVGQEIAKGENIIVVESVKAASDVYAPVAAKVIEVNSAAEDEPALMNEKDPATCWLIKVELSDEGIAQLEDLMDEGTYNNLL